MTTSIAINSRVNRSAPFSSCILLILMPSITGSTHRRLLMNWQVTSVYIFESELREHRAERPASKNAVQRRTVTCAICIGGDD